MPVTVSIAELMTQDANVGTTNERKSREGGMMTPLELSILIHYRGCANDFRDGDFSAPAVRQAIDDFRDRLFLLENINANPEAYAMYRLTERGKVFVNELCKLPLPVQVWVMPPTEKPT